MVSGTESRPRSRAALAEENEILRTHLANLGWDESMLQSTQVRTPAAEAGQLEQGLQEARASPQVLLNLMVWTSKTALPSA